MKKELYNPGDRVVLPPYGVGIVSEIQTKKIAGNDNRYYQVDFPNGSSRAFVPVSAPQSVGLRPALSENELPEIISRLKTGKVSLPRQWAARHRKVTEILASGDPYRIANLAAELRRWDDERGVEGLYLLEINTQPGMTPLSLVPEQAKHMGISYEQLVDMIVKEALA